MIKKFLSVLSIAFVIVMAFGFNYTPVYAYAYGSDFISTIHYQNVGAATANVTISIYNQAGEITATAPVTQLEPGGATSLYAGTISGLSADFMGSAVISSDQPLATTIAQVGSGSVKNQPLSNGFSSGSDRVFIPTVLKNKFYFNSVFSVQNIDSVNADLTLTFKTTEGMEIIEKVYDIPTRSSYVVDMGNTSMIPSSEFNGSVFIEAVQTGTSNPGSIVTTSMELQFNGYNAYAFNGVPLTETSNKIYMPSAVCKFGPNNDSTSAYAVQNPNATAISVTVTYSNDHVDGPYTIAPYAKRSFDGCATGNPKGFLGSAIVTSIGGNVHAVGKVYGGGLYPAHLGFSAGSNKIALPFVRWTEDHWYDGTGQRSYIAIQNIGTSSIADGEVKVYYYDKDGNLLGSHTLGALAVGGKANSHPYYIGPAGYEFGTYPDGSSGGGAIVEGPAGSQLAVVVRVQKYTGGGNSVGEDYEGIPIE